MVRDATLPVLYETLILDGNNLDAMDFGDGSEPVAGWRFTRRVDTWKSREDLTDLLPLQVSVPYIQPPRDAAC